MNLDILVEGYLDEVLLRKLCINQGMIVDTPLGRGGKDYIIRKAAGIAQRKRPLIVLLDAMDIPWCPIHLKEQLIPNCPNHCLVRAVVREIESWVMADRQGLAEFLSVSKDIIPLNPDDLPDPKAKILEIAARSRKRNIRESIVQTENGCGRYMGPMYHLELGRFVITSWDIDRAANSSLSLKKFIRRLRLFYAEQSVI
jgi:hypothetical protein